MDHTEAIRLIEAAESLPSDATLRAALEEHLAGCPECRAYAASLQELDAHLHRTLQARYPESGASAQDASIVLGRISSRLRRQSMFRTIYRTLAWTALAALFMLVIGWSIRFLLPRPLATTGTTPTLQLTSQPTPTPGPTRMVTASPSQTPLPPTGQSNLLFPKASFALGTQLPAAPDQMAIYVQQVPQPLSLEGVRQMAARLGLNAPVYQRAGEGSDPIYVVSDGYGLLTFAGGSPDYFLYTPDYANILSRHDTELPFDQLVGSATTFLKNSSLYQDTLLAERLPDQTNSVGFTYTLDNLPVVYGIGYSSNAGIQIELDSEGRMRQASYGPLKVQPTGQYPILSAEQAWQAFLSGAALNRLRYGVSDPNTPGTFQTWQREYPTGEPVHLYGYAEVLQPAEPGGIPLATFNNWLVAGPRANEFASSISPHNFWHAWGQFQADQQGRQAFYIEGWEVSLVEETYLQGTLRHQGDRVLLATDQGDIELPGLPAGAPDGAFAETRGVLSQPSVLDWWTLNAGEAAHTGYSMMEACGGGGGGGATNDFGGGMFRPVSLEPVQGEPTPTATMQAAPFNSGDSLEAVTGTLSIQQHISLEGVSRTDLFFAGDPVGSFTGFWAAHLASSDTQALEALNRLPIRVWGAVTGFGEDGWPQVEVQRYEEVYLGLRFQAWLGKWQPVTLESMEVLLFTSTEGEQFILGSSIQMGASSAAGLEGDQIVVEGLAFPDQTFGGYPVITESSTSIAKDLTDLSQYQISANHPSVYDASVSEDAQALHLQGLATVEKVELVYATAFLYGCHGNISLEGDLEQSPWRIVQPVWRFTGTFQDGRTFEIQLQALADEYLK